MRVVVLVDNRRQDAGLAKEHGLSLYVETDKAKYMVDAGLSDAFFYNAQKLGIDISQVDYLFLSHGHADHVGGLPFFLQQNKKAKVYVMQNALTQKYFSTRRGLKDISPVLKLKSQQKRFCYLSSDLQVNDEVQVISRIKHTYSVPQGNQFLLKNSENGMIPDDFSHEMLVVFGNGKLLCTGCAHAGILNIMEMMSKQACVEIKHVIGGFHLLDTDDMFQYESADEIKEIGLELKRCFPNTIFYTGHCTGDEAYALLRESMGEQVQQFFTGLEINI
jgi:7,8-dihydropterin-6-yl-methyl-4-(beta-D-ribofuranosyl)aminobenzene 5'-phosphate synthase